MACYALALLALIVAPVLALYALGSSSVAALPQFLTSVTLPAWIQCCGLALVILALSLMLLVQLNLARGGSDVAIDGRNTLVTHGVFAWIRNPIFSAFGIYSFGSILVVPNLVSILGLSVGVLAVELQVCWVEEPYFEVLHGMTYRDYACRTGRFFPGVGRKMVRSNICFPVLGA